MDAAVNGTVATTLGRVSGIARDGHTAFFGIPFAKAKRFAAPEAAEPWSGVRTATTPGFAAPQTAHVLAGFAASGPQDEDCLNLNIFTPAADNRQRPVLLWIHGGGFTHGAGYEALYDGGPLAERGDVVVVTINYRLGAFGFLHLPEIGAHGNQGLLDQVAALHWVRDNIAAFGGDSAQVTIFGQSAGSASVAALLAMPAAKGLFRRAVLQSGAGRAASVGTAARIADAFLDGLDLDRSRARDLLSMPVEALLGAQGRLDANLRFGPVADGATLAAAPIEMVGRGCAKEIDIVIGSNRDEVKQFVAMTRREPVDDDHLLAQIAAVLPKASEQDLRHLVQAYRTSRQAHHLPADNLDILDAVNTDVRFRIPSIQLAENQARSGGRIWMYLFTHASPAKRGALGACHSVEMPFVFGTLTAPTQDRFAGTGPLVERLSHEMMDAWLGFARQGDPAARSIAPWDQYSSAVRSTMIFGTAKSLQDHDPFAEERRMITQFIQAGGGG